MGSGVDAWAITPKGEPLCDAMCAEMGILMPHKYNISVLHYSIWGERKNSEEEGLVIAEVRQQKLFAVR